MKKRVVMFSNIIYIELFIALFFLPGFFITVILEIKKLRFLLSLALSYALLVFTLLPFEYYAQPINHWTNLLGWVWVALAVLATAKTLFARSKRRSLPACGFLMSWRHLSRLMVPLVLAGVICGYLAFAGIYLEIPSDAWTHVFRFQFQKLSAIDQECFPSGVLFKNLFLPEGAFRYVTHWYVIHAGICHVAGLSIMASLHVLTFVNVLTFLLGFYYFGLFLFAGLRIRTLKKMMLAAFAALFAAATMGNMVFAYIRYYALAPTILNYVLFLAAMAVIIDWLRSNRWFGHAIWIAPVLLVVTNMVHAQEALFIFFMTLALSLWETIRAFWRRMFGLAARTACDNSWAVRELKTMIMAGILLFVFFAGFAAIRHFQSGSWVSPHMIMPHAGVPAEPVNFIFRNLIISVPENPYLRLAVYQLFVFYQVVGCWGLFVYLLFALMIRRFVKTPYLVAGMLIVPFLTVFNPLTIDLIVRLKQGAALYRFIYMLPLPFVGGYLFVHFWGKAREWFHKMRTAPAESVSPIWPRLSWLNFAGSILILAGLIGLIFPINTAGIYAPYSKIYTLRKIPAGNDHHLWIDLGNFIEKHAGKVILTDSLSRFITYYSLKNNCIYSEWLSSRNPEKDQPAPYTWESLRGRGMIVVNRCDGAPSDTGRIAKHWPEDVLRVSRYYSPEVQSWLESHPEKFQKVWSRNQIAVYAVR